MRGLSEVVLRPAPAEQATDATLDIRREIGVRDALICAADLMPGASAISEKGIFDFCLGAEVNSSSDSVRKLEIDRPRLTPQFMGRLISVSPRQRNGI